MNGGSDVVAVCNSGGQIELFTIGSDGNIHTFFPDSSSETGYNETTITTGLQATALAAGIDSQGKVIVFAASLPGPVLYYTVETNDPSARWSVPTKVLGIPIPVGTIKIMSMVIQNIAGIPYMAVTTEKSANEYHVSVTSWESEPMTFTLLADNFASDPHCFFQGNAQQNVTLAAFVAPKLLFYPATGGAASSAALTSNLNPISVATVLDASNNNRTFAVLDDGDTYQLVRGPDQDGTPQYSWQPLANWQETDQKIPFQQVVVEADSTGTPQVFSVSAPMTISESDPNHYNVLSHWIIDTDSTTGYATPPTPLHKSIGLQLGGVANDHGTVELFAVEASNLVTHLFQEQQSDDWAVEVVETGTGPIEEYASYATDVTVYDSVGALAVNVSVSVWASEMTRITANGATFFIDAQRQAHIATNNAGMVSIAQETNSLAIPSLQINVPSLMPSEPSIAIQPSADVQNQLAKVTSEDLQNATLEDGSYMLADEYRNDDTTIGLAEAIDQCMGMVGTPALAATTHSTLSRRGPRNGVWYRASGSASDLRRIGSSHVERHWQLSFEGPKVTYQALTPHEAAKLRAEQQASFPSLAGSLWNFFSDIGDLVRGVVDGIVDVVKVVVDGIKATINLIIDGFNYVFDTVIEFVEQAFDMVELLLAQVKVFFEMIFEWLAWLFAAKYILRNKDALAYTINEFFTFLQGAAAGIQTMVDSGFTSLEDQIASIFDQAVNSIAGTSTVGGYEQSTFQSDPDQSTASSNNFVYNEFINNAAQATGPSLMQALQANDPSSQFADQLTEFANMLQGTDAFAQALTYFQKMGSAPDQIFNLLLAGMLRLVQGLVEAGVSSIQALADSLLQLTQTIIGGVQSILNEPWNIPFVSQFYSFITGGSTLTTLDLVALIAAVPSTILYKLSYKSYPFPDDGSVNAFKASFNAQTMLQASGLAQPSSRLASDPPAIPLSTSAIQFLAVSYSLSMFFGGLVTALSDALPMAAPKTLTYTGYLLTAAALACRFPWFSTAEQFNCDTKQGRFNWLWVGGCLGVALAGFFVYKVSGITISSDTTVIAMTIYGGLSLQLAIWASQLEDDAMRSSWMIIPAIPMVSKMLRHSLIFGPSGGVSLLVLAGIDISCFTTAGILGGIILTS